MTKLNATARNYAIGRVEAICRNAAREVRDKYTIRAVYVGWEEFWKAVDDGVIPEPTIDQLRGVLVRMTRCDTDDCVRDMAGRLVGRERVSKLWPSKTVVAAEGTAALDKISRLQEKALDELFLGTDGLEAVDSLMQEIAKIVGTTE